jgi:hypothetical protein
MNEVKERKNSLRGKIEARVVQVILTWETEGIDQRDAEHWSSFQTMTNTTIQRKGTEETFTSQRPVMEFPLIIY